MKKKSLAEKRKTSDSYKDDESDLISLDDLSDGVYLEKDVKEAVAEIKKYMIEHKFCGGLLRLNQIFGKELTEEAKE